MTRVKPSLFYMQIIYENTFIKFLKKYIINILTKKNYTI